ncbi:hypothetical protein TraAM80_06138 [Trypanosoma rangeli]|uniref:Uncharacterized protein n=1 Tax=Trypanosoma rangeli TaxID=5698 RepID=A0A422NBI2_TRYRA|nr:uncharacterized protein TraAM80_06138 [Trypanosoma rangeli]RNF02854.1 hypothetical protein TraAM80_06138 [Trypanosoma rangeli]|eukprot:RNF02854.1 hypothetical protein TraAM80_06138 [Trypanosoma rangeli]
MNPKSRRPLTKSESASDLLGSTLAALDTVISDAQRHDAGNAPQTGKKRQRGGDVFAAMAEPHLHTLQSLVVSYGVQLLPSVDAMVRRVLLAVASPTTANTAAWELAALLGTYFRGGVVRLLEELMELLLNQKGTFLLTAPCVVGLARAAGAGAGGESEAEDEDEDDTAGVLRRLHAFEELLLAVGPCMSASLMQRATLRFAQEVVTRGILDAPPPAPRVDGGKPSRGKKGNLNATDISSSNDNNNSNNKRGTQQQSTASAAAFSVAEAVQPRCVELLTSFLLLCRPLPAVVSVCAVRVLRELPVRPITVRHRREHQHLLRAVSRLSATLTALRHPHALPFYLPPIDVVETPTRRVTTDASLSDIEQATGVNNPHPPQPASSLSPVGATPQPSETRNPAAVETSACARSAESSSPRQPTRAVQLQQQHSFVEPERNSGQEVLLADVPLQQKQPKQKWQRNTPVVPPPPAALAADETDDDDDMPDIDMED